MELDKQSEIFVLSGGTKRVPRAVREQQMLNAATTIFARHGYHNASMEAIAWESSISKPMLYLYYGSKDELFAATLRRESDRFINHIHQSLTKFSDPRSQLNLVVENYFQYVDDHRDAWEIVYRQATAQPAFRSVVDDTRVALTELATMLLIASNKANWPREQLSLIATALVGAGEAVADRVVAGDVTRQQAVRTVLTLAWSGLSGSANFPDDPPEQDYND